MYDTRCFQLPKYYLSIIIIVYFPIIKMQIDINFFDFINNCL